MPQSIDRNLLEPTIPPKTKAPLLTASIAWKLVTIALGLGFFLGLTAYAYVRVDGVMRPDRLIHSSR